ncbi:MAG: 50S ribosomal protein L29 [Candidatus Saccharimonas sp.]
MAKTTKTAPVAKSVTKRKATVVKTVDELQTDLLTKVQDLAAAKRSHVAGELVNPRVLGELRKDIARTKTAIRAATQQKGAN